MMHGSCFCKKIQIEYSGSAPTVALCHCGDCRKLSGAPFTLNFVVKRSDFKITGSPGESEKISDAGNKAKNFFCRDCGSPLYGGVVNDKNEFEYVAMRAGIFDDLDVLNQNRPVAELYTTRRLNWIAPLEGCAQYDGMPPSS